MYPVGRILQSFEIQVALPLPYTCMQGWGDIPSGQSSPGSLQPVRATSIKSQSTYPTLSVIGQPLPPRAYRAAEGLR